MDRLKKLRTVVRSRITKTIAKIEVSLVAEPRIMLEVQGQYEQVTDLIEEIMDLDQKMLDLLCDSDATEEACEEEDQGAQEYKDKLRRAKIQLDQVLNKRNSSPTPSEYTAVSSDQGKRNFKLPKIELKKFNGEYEEYLGWWAQFSKIHEDESLHEADKFHYLLQAMTPGTRAHKLVKSYPPTVENYAKVIEALQDRFGDKSLLAEVYIRKLQSIVLGLEKSKSKFDLCKVYDEIETQLRCLESLEIVLDHSAFMLPLIESTLPIDLLKVWQRSSESGYLDEEKKSTEERLKSLLGFMKREVKGEERIKMIHGNSKADKVQGQNKGKDNDVATSQSLYSGSSTACIFCAKTNHVSPDCLKALHMSLEEKNQKVKESHSCFRCFKRGHSSKDCRSSVTCATCGRRHSTLLCRGNQSSSRDSTMNKVTEGVKVMTSNPSIANISHTSKDGVVLMKTVQVEILDYAGRKHRVRLLFDEGSNRSYIKTSTAENLRCPVIEEFDLQTTLFGGQSTVLRSKKKYKVRLNSSNNKFKGEFQFINEDVICGNCPSIPKGPWMKQLSKNKIFVNDTGSCSSEIEILIGSNLWPQLMTGRMCKIEPGLIAVESVFGWTLSGEIASSPSKPESMCSTVIAMFTQGEKCLPDLWNLETIGIKDPIVKMSQDEHDEAVKATFKENITRSSDGRYVVQLPWIDRNIPLPNYKSACEKSLQSLTNKLKKEDLFITYGKIFKDWEKEGIIQECTGTSTIEHYLPHHRVLKLESKTTPVRPVFNASFKIGNNPSLNDCLERGPNLLELIPAILLRFREKDVGGISDIRKAYQMITVQEDDKNFQKFLWWEDDTKIKIYRHSRVVFGMNCSPFILAAVLELHFDGIQDNRKTMVDKLKESLYVDNSVTSFDSEEEYKIFKQVTTSVLEEAKMDLRQWESNCEDSEEEITNVLGLIWNKKTDTLMCKIPVKLLGDMVINKRSVLSIISQIYDPIGFTVPGLLTAKFMLQKSWSINLPWDEEWCPDESEKFLTWYNEINEIGRIQIPRIAMGSNPENVQVHLFTDASQDAYAAVVYARVKFENCVKVQLLLAKSRLAPLPKKKLKKSKDTCKNEEWQRATIPRLELLGCFIGSRLLKSVKESLKMKTTPTVCWSDSTTALAWIKRDEDWGTFVGNRVREINMNSCKEEWRHVPGHLNPADLPSRGCTPYELRQSQWWEGPSWLYKDECEWPNSTPSTNEVLVAEERKKSGDTAMVNLAIEEIQPKFGSFWKNVRTAAWVRRFINNCKTKPEDRLKAEHLSMGEIKIGENDLFREIQGRHFPNQKVDKNIQAKLEEDGLLHVKTRLTYKEDSSLFKSPILLPGKDALVMQLIEFVHRIYCHAGAQFVLSKLRERYWILPGRRTVNKIIRRCVICKRFSSKSYQVNPAPLPVQRIETTCAFETTGVDLAGPFYLKGNKKAWIVLYTCAVYRGIYIDVVDSLSTEEFINSLHKFTCIIGRPSTMFSDNGTNFVGAQTIMKKLNWKAIEHQFSVKQIKWRFNPPAAPWWGGWWERLIRSVKDLLRRMIATAKLTRKELETCMAEISYVMNNRPLTTLTENEDDFIPLTPAMFMRDLPLSGLPEVEKITGKDLQEAYSRLSKIKEALTARFRKEYLGNLMERKSEKATPDPKIGDVVLVGYDNRKRYEWPLGKILEIYPGKDKNIRVAKVKTARTVLERALQRLYPLEITNSSQLSISPEVKEDAATTRQQQSDFTEEKVTPEEVNPQYTKCGRKVTKPSRYGQWFP